MARKRKLTSRQRALVARRKRKRDILHARRIGERVRELRATRELALVRRPEAPPVEVMRGPPLGAAPVGVYRTLDEARIALDEERRRSSGLATGLAIGLASVAVIGVGIVVCYLLFRRRDGEELQGAPRLVEREIIREIPTYTGRRKKRLGRRRDGSVDLGPGETRMRTFTLPAMNSNQPAVRIANATDRPYLVTVRVVAPIGGFVVLSFAPAELNIVRPSAIPAGETFVMPAGEYQRVLLKPRQAIYAKGSVANVVVSVLSSERTVA